MVCLTLQQFRAARAFLAGRNENWRQRSEWPIPPLRLLNWATAASAAALDERLTADALKPPACVSSMPWKVCTGEGVALQMGSCATSPAARRRHSRRRRRRRRHEGSVGRQRGETPILTRFLGEPPAPDPDMAEMWQADPELWARLSEGGRETLSRSMFGDCRAAGEGYFRGGHHAG